MHFESDAAARGRGARHVLLGDGGRGLWHHGREPRRGETTRWRFCATRCRPARCCSSSSPSSSRSRARISIRPVSLVMWLRGALSRTDTLAYIAVQIVGGCLGAIVAHLMFDLEPLQLSQDRPHGPRAVGRRVHRHVRLDRHHSRLRPLQYGGDRAGCRSLHHERLLVHLVHLLRQPGGDHRAGPERYVFGHRAGRRPPASSWPRSRARSWRRRLLGWLFRPGAAAE